MKTIHRRKFISESACSTTGMLIAPAYIRNMLTDSPNERINVAVIGLGGDRERVRSIIRGRGIIHVRNYLSMPNVYIRTICDVDERLFNGVIKEIEASGAVKPQNTEYDFRNVLDDNEIDIVSLATPDHWHALQTVWACQAGKDIYVEKPVCHNLSEGRKMVEAVQKYNRIVQSGICYRSSKAVKEGMKLIKEGILGKVYMARAIRYAYRDSIGNIPDSPVPDGLHWDLFLGPAPYHPYNLNRFLYNWHWFWDYGTTDLGNLVIYTIDTARWALNKNTHPVRVQCGGGKFGRDDDREAPNILSGLCEYEDGTLFEFAMRSLPTNPEGMPEDPGLCFVYGDQGWMSIDGSGFKTYLGRANEPGPAKSDSDFPGEESNGFKNLVDCVRSGRRDTLDNPMIEGHLSAAIVHLALISYRIGRKLAFNPETEKFIDDKEADRLLTRDYREPYIMPGKV